MRIVLGNVFNFPGIICVTTNLGWNKHGHNIMGAGLAKEAARRDPKLPEIYGNFCQENRNIQPFPLFKHTGTRQYVCVPTKALNPNAPHLSWQQDSTLQLVKQSVQQLPDFCAGFATDQVLVVPFGCRNGKLKSEIVLPWLINFLTNAETTSIIPLQFILVTDHPGDLRYARI